MILSQGLFDDLTLKIGDIKVEKSSFGVFDVFSLDFLEAFRLSLIESNKDKNPEVSSLIYYLRSSNLNRIKMNANLDPERIFQNKGLAFHVCPSNVPTTFAYSLVWGLLSGCINIVKIPSIEDIAKNRILNSLHELSSNKKFKKIFDQNMLVNYDKIGNTTESLSAIADIRIGWGSDTTINELKQMKTKATAHEIFFPDRISGCMIATKELEELNQNEITKLGERFVRDFFDYNQLACSSPSFIVWLEGRDGYVARSRFWEVVQNIVSQKKLLPEILGMQVGKSVKLIHDGFIPANYNQSTWPIKIFRSLDDLKSSQHFSCGYGNFIEFYVESIDEVFTNATRRIQSITYFGIQKKLIQEFCSHNNFNGIDRIVPIGNALSIVDLWDGYSIIREMIREICID